MKIFAAAVLAATTTFFALPANALSIVSKMGVCDASDPVPSSFATFTTTCGDASRSELDAVNLGAADGNFYSLGINDAGGPFGGIAIFEIDPVFTGPSAVVEVTNPSSHWEAAFVYVANSLGELQTKYFASDAVGIVTNGKGGSEAALNTVNFSGTWSYIMFEDISLGYYGGAPAGNQTQDGFDLDSFTVQAVPLPAGVLLLGTGLAGFGLARRRS